MSDGPRKSNLVDITCEIRHETEKAILVHDGDSEAWLPKSLVEIERLRDGTVIITLPEWLASERGFI